MVRQKEQNKREKDRKTIMVRQKEKKHKTEQYRDGRKSKRKKEEEGCETRQ